MIQTYNFDIATEGYGDTADLTPYAAKYLSESGLNEGILTVFVPGSTGGVTTIEYESGALKDLRNALEQIAPEDEFYHHNERWHDGNGFSHVRSALMGPSLTIPFINSRLTLGTWQQIVLLDFDNKSRNREIVIQIIGE